MGSGVPPRGCGRGGELTLRNRLIAAAVGIVGVSLLLSGGLTWVLVRNAAIQGAQDELDRSIASDVALVRQQECLTVPPPCDPVDRATFVDRLQRISSTLGGDRLLLVRASTRRILFDSAGTVTGKALDLQASKRVSGVVEAQPVFDGQPYLAAGVPIPPARDPLGASIVVIARPQSAIAAAAASELLPRLLMAGGAALILALVLVLLVSRSVTGPLTQLALAAEDIAAGNYSRRVGIRGTDEVGQLGTAFDRMAEAVERSRQSQREFLANVSHELKTPLTSLIGFSEALTDGSLKTDEERARAAEIVHEESERVLRMAQELLDLARVEAGTISLHISAVDLAGQVNDEVELVKPRAGARGLSVTTDLPSDLPPVAADPERLHQVLDNLFDNAVKYAPESTEVRVAASRQAADVRLVIQNAVGAIKPDPQRMFERFYRADASRSAAAGGVGLGLAISRELVAAMRGRLWAELDGTSTLRVTVLLPASEVPATRLPVTA
ncbi:MAG TPA: HAMP domain-containing sensor histidine kinase [Candidatus Dormibacteraeota bacterium]|nr:HAMP domain-containing sensor histidine kinase [Candidatus Dormibacteraeota bacterium]